MDFAFGARRATYIDIGSVEHAGGRVEPGLRDALQLRASRSTAARLNGASQFAAIESYVRDRTA